MACQFSAPFQFSLKNVCYSPSGTLLASASGSNLTIRDAASLEILHSHTCIDKIEKIEFSADSEYIFCGIFARCAIQVYSIADPKWRCRINESVAGIVSASWSPDSRHIIVESDFGIQLAIWSLVENMSYIINSPKTGQSNYAFSDCGRYFAVGHRFECKDHIGVYSTHPWAEINKFRTRSNDMVGVQWTPAGTQIVVQDSHLTYRVLVYTPAGEILSQYEAYQNALGIRCMAFHRSSEEGVVSMADSGPAPCPSPLLAIGSYDGQVRLLSTHSWKLAFVLPQTHTSEMLELMSNGVSTTVEVVDTGVADVSGVDLDTLSISDLSMSFSAKRSKEQSGQLGSAYITRPLKALPKLSSSSQQPKNDMLPPKFGVSWMGWSACGNLLAVREESHPRCMWIWLALEARLCDILVQLDNIVCARWRPCGEGNEEALPVLAFSCGTPRVYFWTPNGSSWADLPASTDSIRSAAPTPRPSRLSGPAASAAAHMRAEQSSEVLVQLNVLGLRWSSDGNRLLIIGKERFCSCEVTFSESGDADLSIVEA